MPTVQASGIGTNFETIGSGPLLLLLHGWANTWEAWLPVIPLLSDHFTLLIPDLPGCGKTATPREGWDTAQHAKWLQEFLTTTGSNPVVSVGHSYGGKILLEYASGDYQPQPQKIVLIDASGIPNILNAKQKMLRSLSALTPDFVKQKIGGKIRGKVYASFGADSDYVWANDFQKKTLQKILAEDYTKRIASISQPTLVLWGKEDTSTPLWQGESLHTLLPLSQIKTYESGHFPHQKFAGEVASEIIQFVKK